MSANPFTRLAPFIQDYIYRQKWDELRPVQVKAIQAILDTPHNVLITSGTASGKTEAAILPILTLLQAIPSTSIGVLYIGPLKALINDQFERVQAMLDQSGIPVQSWHGDVARSARSRFLRNAQGILQITPESLEAMLMHRNAELARLFGDLRFVIIDEVHAFINSDRGRQVICQLQRLAYYQKTPPRRIGLSATIGEPELAMTWLSGGSASSTLLIDDADGKRSVQLGLEHFVIKDDPPNIKDGSAAEMESSVVQGDDGDYPNSVSTQHVNKDDIDALYLHMYQMCQNAHKSLIFANTRGDTEKIGYALRELALRHHTPDIYHVHHGSLSAALRETAEDAMRDTSRPTAIAATVTLELGIDVGQLDQVLQLESTHSVSSFVQRLGRSGRRGSPSTMFLYSRERVTDSTDPSGYIPWNLLQTIAIIQLYIEEKWVEPPAIPKYPFSLLYHQTMSTLAAASELSPARLAERVLTLPPFVQISQEQYRTFLLHLLEIQHLEKMETGALIIGLQGEKVVNNYRFYATFEDDSGYKVMAQTREIGSIPSVPPMDTTIGLAGFTWRIVSVDDEHRNVQVQRARGKPQVVWVGGGIDIHDRIVQRVRQVLTEGENYGYLLPHSKRRLQEARAYASETKLTERQILPMGGARNLILPWMGSRVVDTQMRLLKHAGLRASGAVYPYCYYLSKSEDSKTSCPRTLHKIAESPPDADELVKSLPANSLRCAKYDWYVEESLLRQAYAEDQLVLSNAIESLKKISIRRALP